jgi:hypothetical protein
MMVPKFVPEQRTAATASSSFGPDNNWYIDSGTTDHIIGELDKLTIHDAYTSSDQIHVVNEVGMEISYIVTSIIPIPSHNLLLNNVHHVKILYLFTSLLLIMFIEFHPFYFLIKD